MGQYSKYKNFNTVFGGVVGVTVPTGGTADRSPGTLVGTIRYNTDLGLIEQYNSLGWQSVDAPPTIGSVTGIINENTSTTITLTGSNFKVGATVSIQGAAVGGIDRQLATTFVSSSTLTANTNATAVTYLGGQSFDVKVLNPSGLSTVLSPGGTVDRDPLWTTSNASAFTVFDSARGTPLSFVGADPDGAGTITYSLVTGSLPPGASLNTTTGAISGFSAVGSDTSYPFTLRITSTNGTNVQTADRQFTILMKAPVVASFTSTGAASFSVPSGISAIQVLVVAGGGGAAGISGGAGGGGVVYHASYPVTPGGSVPYTVGAGGNPGGNYPGPVGSNGGDSLFGVLTAKGGGGASSWGNTTQSGTFGSGAGQSNHGYTDGNYNGQPGGQPGISNPGASVNAGYPGARGGADGTSNSTTGSGQYSGGGGGGAGQAGGHPSQTGPGDTRTNNSAGRKGGDGYNSSITGSPVFYGGGGGGGSHTNGYVTSVSYAQGGAGGGGRGGSSDYNYAPNGAGEPGTTNRGGGGGGGYYTGGGTAAGGAGGPGIVIIRY